MTSDQGQQGKRFEVLLRRSIREGILSVFGRKTATAVEFYVDSSLAAKDIAAYTIALRKMFGVGSNIIEEQCAQILYSSLGLQFQRKDNYTLSDYVKEARNKKNR